MIRKWSLFAVVLMLIGIAGMTYHHFRFGEPLHNFQRRWYLSPAQLNTLSINSAYSADIRFIDSQDGNGYVEINGKLKPEIMDKLVRTEVGKEGLQLDISPSPLEFLNLNFNRPRTQITVALPGGGTIGLFQLDLHSVSGHIQGLRARSAELLAKSGSLTVTDARADQINIQAASGAVRVEQVEATLNIGMSSGNLTLNQITGVGTYTLSSGNFKGKKITGDVKIKATSGNITLDALTGTGQIEAQSGNVTMNDQRSDALSITTHSGNVILSTDNAFRGFYDLEARSGRIHAPESPKQTSDVIQIRTQSGNITIQ
jgi:hypothetical protein